MNITELKKVHSFYKESFVMQAVQREREEKLAGKLKHILNQYVRGDKKGFIQRAESEVKRLTDAGRCMIAALF